MSKPTTTEEIWAERFQATFGVPLYQSCTVQIRGDSDVMLLSQKELFAFINTELHALRERLEKGVLALKKKEQPFSSRASESIEPMFYNAALTDAAALIRSNDT